MHLGWLWFLTEKFFLVDWEIFYRIWENMNIIIIIIKNFQTSSNNWITLELKGIRTYIYIFNLFYIYK
jgi:hypothetical protein